MSTRTAAWLAWSTWALAVVLVAFGDVLNVLEPSTLDPNLQPYNVALRVQLALTILVVPTVGALVAARRPGNPIGWLLCAAALTDIVRGTGETYARYALITHPGSFPAGELAFQKDQGII